MTTFRETQPDEVPDLIENPYTIVITIRDEDAIHAIDSNSYLRDALRNASSGELIARFAQTLSRMRYQECCRLDEGGVGDAIDEAYAAIGRAVAWQMEQDIREEEGKTE